MQRPQQSVRGFYSVYVRGVFSATTKTGPVIRARAVIGEQWHTMQIPRAIAPGELKKGDYIECEGSVTAVPDNNGASSYLFVDKVSSVIPVEKLDGVEPRSTPQKTSSQRDSKPNAYASAKGGFRSNRPAQKKVETQRYEKPAPDHQSPVQEEHRETPSRKRRSGFRSNRRNLSGL